MKSLAKSPLRLALVLVSGFAATPPALAAQNKTKHVATPQEIGLRITCYNAERQSIALVEFDVGYYEQFNWWRDHMNSPEAYVDKSIPSFIPVRPRPCTKGEYSAAYSTAAYVPGEGRP